MTSSDLFGSVAAAAGYAAARPPLHPRIVDIGLRAIGWGRGPVGLALDIGCGAGLSTEPLLEEARRCVALDPSTPMVHAVRRRVPGAAAAVGSAEALPLPSGSVDLVTAAGSLDFADASLAVPEIARVLKPGGGVLIYDFTTGSPAGQGERWLEEVVARWPRPPRSAVAAVGPRAFDAVGLAVGLVPFTISLPMTRAAYVDYLMTESFVTAVVAGGTASATVRARLTDTIPWPTPTVDVVFDGYVLTATS